MNILVLGSGGREHVLVWKLKQSPKVKKIYCAPGNGGIAELAQCIPYNADDVVPLLKFAREHKIDLTVVGPEAPLVKGVVDAFEAAGFKIFGPTKAAAQLEGSKVFAKDFMARHHVPTAAYCACSTVDAARKALKGFTYPLVIKADGLAAGKGVIICANLEEAEYALKVIMSDRVFKDAGVRVVIEEFLDGEEASILAVADGKDFVILESSQDHKRIFDGDKGSNTGGMGAYSPAPVVTPELLDQIAKTIIRPVIDGMAQEGAPFKGILYAGVMVTRRGPKVLEFNTRLGDPETQAVLPRLKSDIVDIMLASVEGRLAGVKLKWDKSPCVCIVMASGGYPGDYISGKVISGLDHVSDKAVVFHAGTKKYADKIMTAGGRVLGVTALGKDVAEAIKNAYAEADKITFEGVQFRRDIGRKALNRS